MPSAFELLALAKACRARSRFQPSVTLLQLALEASPSPQHLEAARLARDWEQPELASELFAKATLHHDLADEDSPEMALAALAAGERLRLPHGRYDASHKHKEWLAQVEDQLAQFSQSARDNCMRARALTVLACTLTLRRAPPARIEAVLQEVAEAQLRSAGLTGDADALLLSQRRNDTAPEPRRDRNFAICRHPLLQRD